MKKFFEEILKFSPNDGGFYKCPLHLCHEHTVFIKDDTFCCLQCGKSGDLEQLKLLIEEKNLSIELSDEQKRLFAVNRIAMEYFQNSLSISDVAKKYLEDRGLSAEIIKLFHIGYANPDWTATKQYLLKKGFTEDEILKAGLIFRSSKSQKTYDFYRSRIMFPIIDAWGNVVAFSGRTIVNDKSKYVNTSQTPIFHKRRSFFNLNNFDSKLPYIVICEGQMDVIAFARAEVLNAVATLGTALTRTHAYIISKIANEVYFCFDGDTAGQSALKKAESLFAEIGNVKTKKMKMPHSCKDADEVLKMYGKEGIIKLFETAS